MIVSTQILALVAVRKAMDYVFSQHDLSYLDDVIPEKDKKKKEDEKKKKGKKKGSIDSEIEFVSTTSLFSAVHVVCIRAKMSSVPVAPDGVVMLCLPPPTV